MVGVDVRHLEGDRLADAHGDPLAGVVTGLARQGGNVTGLSALVAEVSGKRVQLLKEAIPGIRRIAVMTGANAFSAQLWRATAQSARATGLEPHRVDVVKAEDLGPAFDAAIKHRADAFVVGLGPVMQNSVTRIVDLATKHRLPGVFMSREFVDAGGLMAYGVSYPDLYRRAATYVDKIFKGAKPGDLPIEQSTKFELVINLKTAKALGLAIPQSVLLQADEVIQ